MQSLALDTILFDETYNPPITPIKPKSWLLIVDSDDHGAHCLGSGSEGVVLS